MSKTCRDSKKSTRVGSFFPATKPISSRLIFLRHSCTHPPSSRMHCCETPEKFQISVLSRGPSSVPSEMKRLTIFGEYEPCSSRTRHRKRGGGTYNHSTTYCECLLTHSFPARTHPPQQHYWTNKKTIAHTHVLNTHTHKHGKEFTTHRKMTVLQLLCY